MDDDKGEHWEEGFRGLGEWNDHEHHGNGELHREWKTNLMFRDDGLEVRMHRGCLSGMNGMELCNNSRKTIF
jgi:hypothetical protein